MDGLKNTVFSAQFVISKRQKCAWLRSRPQTRPSPSQHPSRQRTNLSMPTIGESSVISNIDYDDHAYGEMDSNEDFTEIPLKRPLRPRSCRIPATSNSSLKHKLRPPMEGWAHKKHLLGTMGLFSQI